MAENSKIEWTDHTFNPWRGCAKVAPGCSHCYAEVSRPVRVYGTRWGTVEAGGTRTLLAEAGWREPVKWEKQAAAAIADSARGGGPSGGRPRVFCASLADVFEDWQGPMLDHNGEVFCNVLPPGVGSHDTDPASMDDIRARLFALIDATPHLDWILLTKRPENIRRLWPATETPVGPIKPAMDSHGTPGWCYRKNVWLVTSVSDHPTAEQNVPHLMGCRDLAPVLGVSAEPLLGPVDVLEFYEYQDDEFYGESFNRSEGPDWWIWGGESDQPGQPPARPCYVEQIRAGVNACRVLSVPCHVKQLGDNTQDTGATVAHFRPEDQCWPDVVLSDGQRIKLDPKGGDWDLWPEDLRVREYPVAV